MEAVISNDDRIAIAEVDYVIHHMNERYLSKIPQNLQDYITILKKRNHKIYVDPHKPLEQQGLKEFTLYFLMILNLKYWCDDARRKEILLMLENNQKKYDEKVNNIFGNAEALKGEDSSNSMPNKKITNSNKQGVATFQNVTKNKEKTHNVEAPVPTSHIELTEESKTNAIDDLAKETNAIANVKTENFFIKFINKVKKMLIRK